MDQGFAGESGHIKVVTEGPSTSQEFSSALVKADEEVETSN